MIRGDLRSLKQPFSETALGDCDQYLIRSDPKRKRRKYGHQWHPDSPFLSTVAPSYSSESIKMSAHNLVRRRQLHIHSIGSVQGRLESVNITRCPLFKSQERLCRNQNSCGLPLQPDITIPPLPTTFNPTPTIPILAMQSWIHPHTYSPQLQRMVATSGELTYPLAQDGTVCLHYLHAPQIREHVSFLIIYAPPPALSTEIYIQVSSISLSHYGQGCWTGCHEGFQPPVCRLS